MASKRELVLKAFHNEPAERVPVGFWHHYLDRDKGEFVAGLTNPELLSRNLEAAAKFRDDFDPDFVKIMTDGFFYVPVDADGVERAADLKNIRVAGPEHPFYEKSAELARGYREIYGEDTPLFYNLFAPYPTLSYYLRQMDSDGTFRERILDFIKEDGEAVKEALEKIAEGINILIGRVVGDGLADGVYLSVMNPGRAVDEPDYRAYITPSEKLVLAKAKELSPDNILHICGYFGRENILSLYQDYDVEVVNWAVYTEHLGLADGKKFFGGKAVIGGFNNTPDSTIYKGTKAQIRAEVHDLLAEAGGVGVILGADCTIPADTPVENLIAAREAAAEGGVVRMRA